MNVSSKSENYQLYEAGAFGNKLRTWKSFEQLKRSNFEGKVVMRYKGSAGGAQYPRLGEHLALEEARAVVAEWRSLGARLEDIRFNEAAPDGSLLIQGELIRSEHHFSLFWSREKVNMRKAMQHARQSHGILALYLMRENLFPSSLDDIEILLEQYPECVIEFSAYNRAVGDRPRRNAVIWEVRNY